MYTRHQDFYSIKTSESSRCDSGQVPLYHPDPNMWQNTAQRPRSDDVFPRQMEANIPHNKDPRLDPTLAYPLPLRPGVFQHARFIDKMQTNRSVTHTVKQEKTELYPEEQSVTEADPRRWTRDDVAQWLRWSSEAYSLGGIRVDKFQMNGKALCLMTMDMFLYRVPEGGGVLYQDFQRRLRSAVTCQS